MTPSDVRIVPVTTEQQRRAFAVFPWRLYRNDPNWVPYILGDRLKLLDPERHPFWEHAEQQLFLAMRGQQVVGTISAHINHLHNEVYKDKVGFFGFFEVIDDYAVAKALLDAAADWLRARGMDAIRGPESPSQNEEAGLLVDGFDLPPVVMMTYNPHYYQAFIEKVGYQKAQDLYAWDILTNIFDYDVQNLPRKFVRVAEEARKRPDLVLRKMDLKHFDREVELVKLVYNAAWEQNWGFVPMTDHEFEQLAEDLKFILDPDLAYFAEVGGKVAGFSLGLPDANQALLRAHPQPNNWSFLWTVVKLLWHKRKINSFRLIAMGVVPEYRTLGIDALFYVETARQAFRKGYQRCEMSWILESNDMMNRIIERLGGKVYKTYRIYQQPL
jgi:GNAT superfamily N-acetyltransferase